MRATARFAALMSASLVFVGIHAAGAADPKSPDQVHTALRILASVYADMDAKLKNQQFDRLPHENQEFQEGSGAMRDAIADEPADFKAKVHSFWRRPSPMLSMLPIPARATMRPK